MLATFQWVESSPAIGSGATASSQAVKNTDSSSTAGILSSSGLEEAVGLLAIAEITADASGTLDVYLQTFLLGTWYDIVHFKQTSGGGSAVKSAYVLGPGYSANGIPIGSGTSPALANDTVVGGPWGEKFRLMMVPGSGAAGGSSNVKVTLVAQLPRQWGR